MTAKLEHESLGTISWDGETVNVEHDQLAAQANLQRLMSEGVGDGNYHPTPLGYLYAALSWLGLGDGVTDSSITGFKQPPEGAIP